MKKAYEPHDCCTSNLIPGWSPLSQSLTSKAGSLMVKEDGKQVHHLVPAPEIPFSERLQQEPRLQVKVVFQLARDEEIDL